MSADAAAPPEWADELGPDDGMLVVSELTKEFGGITALDDLSFAVQEGEILGFIGPNGAGKSTTFNCITGVYPPTSGKVWYQGENVTTLQPYEMVDRGIARTYQSFRPLQDRTVLQNVALSLVPDRLFSLAGLRGDTLRKAEGVCELVGLEDRLEMTPDELPHAGMIRLELARALATNPDTLLLDEPFAGLSGPEVENISDVLTQLREDAGVTLVVVDHNMRGLFPLVDRVIVLRFGDLLAEGTPEEVRSDPMVKEAYLGGGAK
ncbi:MAG: ABC transporter ATP-binding protein [Haloarculaceae archaeon]